MSTVPSPLAQGYSDTSLPIIDPAVPIIGNAGQIAETSTEKVMTAEERSLLDQSTLFVRAGFVDTSGQLNSFTDPDLWRTTDMIPVALVAVGQVRLLGDPGASSIAYWRGDRSFLSGVSAEAFGDFITSYSPPASAEYVTFTARWPVATQIVAIAPRFATVKAPESASALALGDGNLFGQAYLRGFMSSATPPVFVPDANWRTSDRIKVKEGDNVSYASIAANGMRILSFYDADGAFVSGVNGSGFDGLHVGRAPVPTTATTMQICVGVSASAPNTVYYQGSVKLDAPANLEAEVGNLLSRYGQSSGYINTSGAPSDPDPNWQFARNIPVMPGRFICYDCVAGAGMNIVSFFDAAGSYIPANSVPGAFAQQRRVRGVAQVPAGAARADVSWGNIDNPSNTLGWGVPWASVTGNEAFTTAFLYSTLYPAFSQPVIAPSDVVSLYGDSRFSTDYPFVAKAWAKRFGCTVLAKGLSGHTVEQLASDADLATLFSGPDPRLLAFMPGGNDTGAAGSVGTFSASSPNGLTGESVVSPLPLSTATPSGATFIQNVDLALRKMIAHYGNVRARAGITGGDSEATKIAKLAATTKVEILPVTDLPQQRNNSSDAFSQPPNWKRKRQSVSEAAARLNLRCLDFQGFYPIDMSLEPYFVAPTDLTTNSGNLFMDGLHPNEVLAQLISDGAYAMVA